MANLLTKRLNDLAKTGAVCRVYYKSGDTDIAHITAIDDESVELVCICENDPNSYRVITNLISDISSVNLQHDLSVVDFGPAETLPKPDLEYELQIFLNKRE